MQACALNPLVDYFNVKFTYDIWEGNVIKGGRFEVIFRSSRLFHLVINECLFVPFVLCTLRCSKCLPSLTFLDLDEPKNLDNNKRKMR